MRRILIGWLIPLVLCGGCMRQDIVNLDSKGKNIVCFGDSLTQGFGAPAHSSYPATLAKLTNRAVVNAGIEGDTSGEALKRVQVDAIDKDPMIVIVEFGANDFLTKVPLEETVKNMEEIISAIQASGAMVAIADISGSVGPFSPYSREYRMLSRKMKAIYIPDILEGIITNSELKSDHFHPNASGYRIIGHRVYRAILPYLNQNVLLNKYKK